MPEKQNDPETFAFLAMFVYFAVTALLWGLGE